MLGEVNHRWPVSFHPNAFPSAREIRSTATRPAVEESIYQRMQAPFAYLNADELRSHREAARSAGRASRSWLFREPEVVRVKARLALSRETSSALLPAAEPVTSLTEFLALYLDLFCASCVAQKQMADVLTRAGSDGRVAYVHSVSDAMDRPNRNELLADAMTVFASTYRLEQRRFAFGSSLKDVIVRELVHYPSESHQLLLTSTRGDFWSRYHRDLLACCERPSTETQQRVAATYFNGDEPFLHAELGRISSVSKERARVLQEKNRAMEEALGCARIKKGYAKLGDMPGHRIRYSMEAKRNILAIDQLLWIDNVLEKIVDHKMLLHHCVYLRLHIARLLAAQDTLTAQRSSSVNLAWVTSSMMQRTRTQASQGDEWANLVGWFGAEAAIFAVPDSELIQRLEEAQEQCDSETAWPESYESRSSSLNLVSEQTGVSNAA